MFPLLLLSVLTLHPTVYRPPHNNTSPYPELRAYTHQLYHEETLDKELYYSNLDLALHTLIEGTDWQNLLRTLNHPFRLSVAPPQT